MKTLEDYTKVIELNPKSSKAYSNRGIAKFKSGDKNGGCMDWSKAGELGDYSAYDKIKEHCN